MNQLIHIGFGNLVNKDKIIAVVSPDSAPVKRLVQKARENGTAIDATQGRKTKAVLVMENSQLVLSALLPDTIGGAAILKAELPCRYGSIAQAMTDLLDAHQPDILLSVGHAGRVNGLEVEWLGVNRDDCSLADNDGIVRKWTSICEDGADAYFTDLNH